MDEQSPKDQIRELFRERFGWDTHGFPEAMPLDISRPNLHDSKREFLLERDTVQSISHHLRETLRHSTFQNDVDDPDKLEMLFRLREKVLHYAGFASGVFSGDTASALAKNNVIATGFYNNFVGLAQTMLLFYEERLKDLAEQEALFWKVKNRPPNYYARTIALRVAKFYAGQTQEKPTFGISRDGSHPSTDYGRLLEHVFQILDIDGTIRGPAVWAISQLTDEDLKPSDAYLTTRFANANPHLTEFAVVSPFSHRTQDKKGIS